jgi:hypothetical protein
MVSLNHFLSYWHLTTRYRSESNGESNSTIAQHFVVELNMVYDSSGNAETPYRQLAHLR